MPRLTLPLAACMAALTLAPAPAGAIALRNMELEAHLNEYPPGSHGTNYSACWTYVHHDGREYAAIGVGDGGGGQPDEGTAIYNVTDPANPYRVAFIPGPPSIWREMKQYRSWLYIVSEGTGTLEGVQIVRMTDPENPVHVATYAGNFVTAHTVSVDTSRALLICNGTKYKSGPGSYPPAGMRLLSLADPEAPVELSTWPPDAITPENEYTVYVHDSVPVGDRLYASSIFAGIQRVFDISDPALPSEIVSWTYPGGFTHNAWPDKTGSWLYLTDEKNGEPLKVFDISNLAAPVPFNTYTPNPDAIVHNVHAWGDELFVANYTEGVRILDISDPAHPAEFAYADTYAGVSGDFNGVWEVAALPSGTVIASDRNSGLWVFRPQRSYGLLRVRVTEVASAASTACACGSACALSVAGDSRATPLGATGGPGPAGSCRAAGTCCCAASGQSGLGGVTLFRDAGAESLVTTSDGVAVFALDPGTHTIAARRFGYHPAEVTRSATAGSRDTVAIALQAKPRTTFSGAVLDAGTQAPLPDAEVILAYGPLHDHTDAAGEFLLTDVPEDLYRVEVRAPGYVPVAFERQIGPGPASMSFQLAPAAHWDPLETGTGWVVGADGDDATTNARGMWVHVDPVGTEVSGSGASATGASPVPPGAHGFTRPSSTGSEWRGGRKPAAAPAHEGHGEAEGLHAGPVQTEDDRTPAGTKCFVTGQGTSSSDIEGYDLDGRTTLTSPALDATGMTIPTIGYWRWFFTSTGGLYDYLATLISNDGGATWTAVDTTRDLQGHWQEGAIRIADFVVPTEQVKVRFVAVDGGGVSVVEAAIDDLTLYDAALQPVGAFPEPPPARLAFRRTWPNPARGTLQAILDLPRDGPVRVDVLDLQGRRVATPFQRVAEAGPLVISWAGLAEGRRAAEPGIYFLRAEAGGRAATARFTLLR